MRIAKALLWFLVTVLVLCLLLYAAVVLFPLPGVPTAWRDACRSLLPEQLLLLIDSMSPSARAVLQAVLAGALPLWKLTAAWYRRYRKRRLMEAGRYLGTALVQRHTLRREKAASPAVVVIRWDTVSTYAEGEMAALYACEESARAVQTAADAATKAVGSPIPRFATAILHAAYAFAVNRICACFSLSEAPKRLYVVFCACEDQAEVVCSRFFVMPLSMLMLFLDLDFVRTVAVHRPQQWYRPIALHLAARQIFLRGRTAGAADGFKYSLRFLRLPLEDGDVDWWSEEWSPAPATATEEQIAEASAKLCHALAEVPALSEFHVASQQAGFQAAFTAALKAAQKLPPAVEC